MRDDLRTYDFVLIWVLLMLASAPMFPMAFADSCGATGATMVDGKICTMPLASDREQL